jgi:tetratricopeptide (TPR) repeat protein
MRGRTLAALLGLALLFGLAAHTTRARDRLLANRIVRQVELMTMAAVRSGSLSPRLVAINLAALRRAAALDPAEVAIPMARGGQFILLGRPHAALEAYGEALAVEPRPEIYLNLARAHRAAGDAARAQQALDRVSRLDPYLADTPDPLRP